MDHMRVACVLIALFAINPLTNNCQTREPQSLGDFAIEITYQRGVSTHFPLAKSGSTSGGSFTLNPTEIFKRADQDSEQVSLVYFTASPEGNAWKIKVSVVKGEFYDKGQQDVATYLVREGEKVTVKEMERFGVRSFDLGLVRLNQATAS